jgi:SAM-dependent methyltransferase
MEIFDDYAYYYDLLYRDKDYAAEAEQIQVLLSRYATGQSIKSILNLGCGTGRHDFALADLGYQMCGIDMSPTMVRMAEDAKKDLSNKDILPIFEVADIREYEPKGKYDAVISLFHVISYQNTNNDALKAFQTAAKALEAGGIFIFDVWYGPGVLSDKPTARIKKISDGDNLLLRYANPLMEVAKNIVEVNYDIIVTNQKTGAAKRFAEKHIMRYYFRPEIELMLGMCGFELLACLDSSTLEETTFDSWTAFFVAKKTSSVK